MWEWEEQQQLQQEELAEQREQLRREAQRQEESQALVNEVHAKQEHFQRQLFSRKAELQEEAEQRWEQQHKEHLEQQAYAVAVMRWQTPRPTARSIDLAISGQICPTDRPIGLTSRPIDPPIR